MTKQLNEMRQEIQQLRAAALAAQDRLDALEQQPPPTPADGEYATTDQRAQDRPLLEVVRLLPEPDPAKAPEVVVYEKEAAAADEGPRPVVRANPYGSTIGQTGGENQQLGTAGATGRYH